MWNARLWGSSGTPQAAQQDQYWRALDTGGEGPFYTQPEPGTREPERANRERGTHPGTREPDQLRKGLNKAPRSAKAAPRERCAPEGALCSRARALVAGLLMGEIPNGGPRYPLKGGL